LDEPRIFHIKGELEKLKQEITVEIHRENGRPRSRANAKAWREAEAEASILLTIPRSSKSIVIPFTLPMDMEDCRTYKYGYG
jgi:hypothetical protein